MKWMIASDLHGSAYYCKKLLEAYKYEQADRLVLLGDLLYHGPRNDLPKEYNPKLVIQLLNKHKQDLLCVCGNCDSEVDQMVLEFPILANYCIISDEHHMIYCTHGHHYNQNHLPPLHKNDVLLCGHTHIPTCIPHEEYIYMNPGSTSLPKEDSWHGYMIYEDGLFTWKDFNQQIKLQYQKKS